VASLQIIDTFHTKTAWSMLHVKNMCAASARPIFWCNFSYLV